MKPHHRSLGSAITIGVVALAWAAGIGVGVAKVYRFQTTPGTAGAVPLAWPMASSLHRSPNQATAVMLVHPECSCTSASLSELADVVRAARTPLSVWVLIVKETDIASADFASPSSTKALRIPGVHVMPDPLGVEAARFGALTSGFIVVYDRGGRLRFSGGITASRGHAGENMGRNQLLEAITDSTITPQTHPVYGCALASQSPRESGS